MTEPAILIEGIGGIGGVLAARLLQAGLTPQLITNNEAITAAINSDGIRIKTDKELVAVKANALTSLSEIKQKECFDVALLIMKANGVTQSARETLPLLTPNGYLVTMQNGIVEDVVAKIVGPKRLISGIIGWGGTFHSPGVYEKTGPGETHIGELDGQVTERISKLAEILAPTSPVVVSENIRGALWSKLAINTTVTTMGALTGETLGEMLKDRKVRDTFLTIYAEVVDTAEALGIKLERIVANPKLLYLPKNAGWFNRFLKDKLSQIVGKKYGRLKSSSLQSLERGRKTEIEYLNKYVVDQAEKAHVDVPLNAALVRMITEIEDQKRPIEKNNMTELLALM